MPNDRASALLSVMSAPSLFRRPLGRPFEPGDDHEERGLAGARRAEQRQELAAADVERHVLQRAEGAERLADADRLEADRPRIHAIRAPYPARESSGRECSRQTRKSCRAGQIEFARHWLRRSQRRRAIGQGGLKLFP